MKLKLATLTVFVSLFLGACSEDTTYDEMQANIETEIIDQNNVVEGGTGEVGPRKP